MLRFFLIMTFEVHELIFLRLVNPHNLIGVNIGLLLVYDWKHIEIG